MEHPDHRDMWRRQLLALIGAFLFTLLFWLAADLLGGGYAIPLLTAVYWAGVLVMVWLSWTGRSRHWPDPAMTLWHMLWSILFVTLAILAAPPVRPVMMMAYLTILPFGVLGLGWRSFLALCLVEVCCYSLASVMVESGSLLDERLDILMGLGFLLAVMAFGLIGREVMVLRDVVVRRNRDLRIAMARIESLAVRDDLTGLCNRRHFESMAERARAASARDARPFVLALVEVDHFDDLREAHGERCADRVQAELGMMVQAMLREVDLVGRFGEGVFSVLLANAGLLAGEQVLERVRDRVACDAFAIEQVRITLSISVAQYQPSDSVDSMLQRLEVLLTEARQGGGNLVISEGSGLA